MLVLPLLLPLLAGQAVEAPTLSSADATLSLLVLPLLMPLIAGQAVEAPTQSSADAALTMFVSAPSGLTERDVFVLTPAREPVKMPRATSIRSLAFTTVVCRGEFSRCHSK